MTVRVVIADDHAIVRAGTRDILEGHPAIAVVGEAGNGEAVLSIVEDLRPDVVVLDMEMPVLDGLEACRRIRGGSSGTSVLILSVHDEDAFVIEAIRAGASGYLLKHARSEELVGAVLGVAAGEAVLDSSLTSKVIAALRVADPEHVEGPRLTARQLEVLRLVADGLSNRQVASALGLSERTVEVHLTNVFKALGVSSRTEAVTSALRQGLIRLGGRE